MSEKKQMKYANGMYYKKRTFSNGGTLGQTTFHKRKFIEWLEAQEEDEKGYVRVDINEAQNPTDPKNTHYITLNEWKPNTPVREVKEVNGNVLDKDDLPF
jgi:hypothetical protein